MMIRSAFRHEGPSVPIGSLGRLLLLCIPIILMACTSEPELRVDAPLINHEGEVIGHVNLEQRGDGLVVSVEASNLPPGERGMHIHDQGLCEPPEFRSAGSHVNPESHDHGLDGPDGGHAGDLRNLEVDEDGTASQTQSTSRMTLRPGEPHSILDGNGSTLVIHINPDDYTPESSTGTRIACAEISG